MIIFFLMLRLIIIIFYSYNIYLRHYSFLISVQASLLVSSLIIFMMIEFPFLYSLFSFPSSFLPSFLASFLPFQILNIIPSFPLFLATFQLPSSFLRFFARYLSFLIPSSLLIYSRFIFCLFSPSSLFPLFLPPTHFLPLLFRLSRIASSQYLHLSHSMREEHCTLLLTLLI